MKKLRQTISKVIMLLKMSLKELTEPVSETKMFRTLYKQLKAFPEQPRSQIIDAINYLDENYYTLRRVEFDKASTLQTDIQRQIDSIPLTPDNPNLGMCRTVRYYTSWLESEMIAEQAEPTDTTQTKRQSKLSILSYMAKNKGKEKSAMNSMKLVSKESKRQTIYLYIQFEFFQPVVIPKMEDRLNLIGLLYALAKELRDNGILVDLSLSSIVKDREKRLKFLRRSSKSTDLFDQDFLKLFMHIMTGSDKRQSQLKLLPGIEGLPVELKQKLTSEPTDPKAPESLIHFLTEYIESEINVQMTMAGVDCANVKCCIKNGQLLLRCDNDSDPTYTLPLKECVFEYRKNVKVVDVIVRHEILQPILLRLNKHLFHTRFFKQISRET